PCARRAAWSPATRSRSRGRPSRAYNEVPPGGPTMPRPANEREFAVEVVRRLRAGGHEALFAGGCVRDELLGLTPKDYDVTTAARPERVRALFNRTVAVGASFGVVEVIGPRVGGELLKVQVATFRADLYEDGQEDEGPDGRHPTSVVFCSAEEDAKRRDFT